MENKDPFIQRSPHDDNVPVAPWASAKAPKELTTIDTWLYKGIITLDDWQTSREIQSRIHCERDSSASVFVWKLWLKYLPINGVLTMLPESSYKRWCTDMILIARNIYLHESAIA